MRLRSKFLYGITFGLALTFVASLAGAVAIRDVKPGEDVFAYVTRVKGQFDQPLYQQVLGAANSFKEGDEAIGVAADDDASRENARKLLANTKIKDLMAKPLFVDAQYDLITNTTDMAQYNKVKDWTLGELKDFLLTKSESQIKGIMYGLHSDIIGNVVKMMSNDELTRIGQTVFNPLPGSNIGAKGYLSARIQPNSPTDNADDIVWQVFDAYAYAVGDLVVGTNPVDSEAANIENIELALRDVMQTFDVDKYNPWCVLSHIDVQAEVEKNNPGSTAIWFQSLAGVVDANKTFDLTLQKMMDYARMRTGKYGLYHETGQGADFTNGHGKGFDMVVHESRKYGFARALKQQVAAAQTDGQGAWCHVNDVAGFIGPEIFKTREQLVRCCLEDIAMGKLHGLIIGLDICSTLHMPVTLDDLDWCQDQIAPANPGYLMALPTKNDPMLSYLTTAYQDHVRMREKFGYKINDDMWNFFKKIEIIDANGKPTEHFGDPIWVYYKYQLAKGDTRSMKEIYAEGQKKVDEIQARGVPLAIGYGENIWDLEPKTNKAIHDLYDDAKISLWAEFTPEFIASIPNAVTVQTKSADREDYVAHPSTGEEFSDAAVATLEKLRAAWGGKAPDVQIVLSDGLNAKALMDEDHLMPFMDELKSEMAKAGWTVAKENIVVTSGRVRAGYQAGDILFKDPASTPKAIIHIIGERPGSGHHAYSVYMTRVAPATWAAGTVDHDVTKVISGISNTGLDPRKAARQTVRLLQSM
ncbi:ethanolamine ammonia-lyase [Syntrophotalea carbinolica DSM 2380]|uniref:Ethanolamine ammonia-lyase n=1 Tax=Syntrophotalea carbinolica (strain DSM 2380 / NBRC 103641 / GraBd1) TaxID=338963 RepID=Q3A793_SYNC1|nr:ethanolamine ammonia-lyase [Syntrophotalea carbinolica]ABA87751.1 ethanolamine ammonia-lyase [Syntrophotalea carbinolica DSM 2380]